MVLKTACYREASVVELLLGETFYLMLTLVNTNNGIHLIIC